MSVTCCVIGQTQLAIDCSKVLLKKGILIQQIFTDDPDFEEWARCLTIDVEDTDYLQSLMKENASSVCFAKFDYLFSIVNDVIIPHKVLSAVKKLSINYHNGPLPKYGGANATNWALLSGEKSHGIVWHIMLKEVDSGSVLVRREVAIDTVDNMQTLNWKCWEAARESFEELCDNLPYNHTIETSNTLTILKKTVDKPSAFCIIPFHCSAQEVLNFFRGTCHLNNEGKSTSNQPNMLGLPKLFISDLNKLYVITGINVLKEALIPHSTEPGRVVSIADHLRVSTSDNDVMITDLLSMDGLPVSKPFVNSLSLKIGTVLNISEAHDKDSYLWNLSKFSLAGRRERKWISELNHPALNTKATVPILGWPYSILFNASSGMQRDYGNLVLCSIDNHILLKCKSSYQPEVLVLASVICYLLMLTPTLSGSVDIRLNGIPSNSLYLQSILSTIPATFQLLQSASFIETINIFSEKLSSVVYGKMESNVRKNTIASDIFLRYSLQPINNEILVGIAEEGETLQTSALNNKRVAIFCSKKSDSVDINLILNPDNPIVSIQTLKDNFLSFLNCALTNNGTLPIAKVVLCSKESNHLLRDLRVLNGPQLKENFPTWFHRPFEEMAKKFPFGVAVIDETGKYTYQELNQTAEAIGHIIYEKMKGNQFGRVALLLDRTWLSLAATIASLKLGITFIPLEKESPVLFNCQILDDANVNLLLVDDNDHWVQHWQEYAKCTCNFSIISLHDIPQFSKPVQQTVECSPTTPAVLLYTSGTTGKPKGILIHHKGLCNVINCVVKEMCIKPRESDDTTVEYSLYDTSPTFDTCFVQIIPILWNGGTVIIVPTHPFKPCKNSHLFRHVTFICTTPSKLFLYKAEEFRSARNVSTGGEYPSMELYKRWKKANRTLWNLYGPTEISIFTTMGIIVDQVHLGKAIDNSMLQILNPLQTEVPIGVPGELYILGAGVAEGYTCDKMTKEVFGVDPESGLRWYRTGDLVVLDHHGFLKYIGRIPSDTQVKIGGKRVEPLGVEYTLKMLPGIEYAEVIVERPARNVNLLVAYVAPESVNVGQLNSQLKRLLPEHMLPSLIIPVDLKDAELSRTGKLSLDKTKYRHMFSKTFQPARSEMEKELLVNYRQLLGIAGDKIFGMHDSFRTYGGDSVVAVTLSNKIHDQFGWNVKPIEILNCTPAEIVAKQIPGREWPANQSVSTAGKAHDAQVLHNQASKQDVELSGMQQSLLQMCTTQVGASYTIPVVFEIVGAYDIFYLTTAIEAALSTLSNYKQYNSSSVPYLIDVDLTSCQCGAKESALAMIQRDSCTPLDLNRSPYRCKIYHLSSTQCILSLLVHHIVFDYQSRIILQSIIETVYDELYNKGSVASNLPASESLLCWGKYVQSECNEYKLREKDINKFWNERLHGYPCFIPFPTSFPRPYFCYHRGKKKVQKYGESLFSKLIYICQALDIQPVCFILSIFALLIHQLSNQEKFCIAVASSRRTSAEHKKAVGFLANTLICNFTSAILNSPFLKLLQYTQSWHEEAQKQGCIPFSELVNIWGYKSEQKHFPQFLLNCISDCKPLTFHLGEGISVIPITIETYTAKAELLLDVMLSENDFCFTWEYDTHLFTDDAIKLCIIKAYQTLLYQKLIDFGIKLDKDCYPCSEEPLSDQLIRHWNSDSMTKEPISDQFMLSSYQRAMLNCIDQTPLSLRGCFNCICSFDVSPTFSKQNVQHAIQKVVECNLYLQCIVSQNYKCLVLGHSGLDLCYESVVDEKEAEAIRCRELLWPFDICIGPLFHCTLMHDKKVNISKVMISASQIFLDEQSLTLFCKMVHDTLLTEITQSFVSPHLTTGPSCLNSTSLLLTCGTHIRVCI